MFSIHHASEPTSLFFKCQQLFLLALDVIILFICQALSGAGYPGVASMDIIDNVIPFVSGEEEKLQIEPRKILGGIKNDHFEDYPVELSAHCNRF